MKKMIIRIITMIMIMMMIIIPARWRPRPGTRSRKPRLAIRLADHQGSFANANASVIYGQSPF